MYVCLITSPPAVAQRASIEPLHRIQLPASFFPLLLRAVFSPDGESLYVLTTDEAINLWELLVYFWPEVGGAVLAVAALIFAIAIRRILRTPRIPGELHCRYCNYCLKSTASDRCTECGQPIRRPIRGRTTRRRVLPVAIPLMAMAIGYALPWALGAPRSGWFGEWQNWWSYDIESVAAARGINLAKWRRPVDRVYEVDTVGGFIRRTLFTQIVSASSFDIAITPDGSGLVMPIARSGGLGVIDVLTGRIRAELPPGKEPSGFYWSQVSGFDGTGDVVYFTILDEPARRTKLLAWNTRTGESRRLLEVAADVTTISQSETVFPRRIFRIPGNGLRFLELSGDLIYAGRGSASTAQIHDLSADGHSTLACGVPHTPGEAPGFASDGSIAFFDDDYTQALDLSTGKLTTGIPGFSASALSTRVRDRAPIGKMILIADVVEPPPLVQRQERRAVVADLDRRVITGQFLLQLEPFGLQFIEAPNGKFFAIDRLIKGPMGIRGIELWIYDLRSLLPGEVAEKP